MGLQKNIFDKTKIKEPFLRFCFILLGKNKIVQQIPVFPCGIPR